MKTFPGFAFSALLVLAACSTTNPRWEAADLRTRHEFIIQQHMLDCAAGDQSFPVFNLGAKEVEEFNERYVDLKLARMEFEAADAELRSVLLRDPEYRANEALLQTATGPQKLDEWRKRNAPVFARLEARSYEYQVARAKRQRALMHSNRLTAERILRDYREQNRILPIAWIGEDRIRQYSRRF